MDRRVYDDNFLIEGHHWWFVARRRILVAMLEQALADDGNANRKLLDVGCGNGEMLGHLSRFGHVLGIDAEDAALAYCRQRGFNDVMQVGELPLPFEDQSFHVITILDVLEHTDDDIAMLRELRRVTKPGGTVLVTVPAFNALWSPHDEISHHRRRYVRRQLADRLERAGLSARRLSYFNTILFPPIAAMRFAGRLRRRQPEPHSDLELTDVGPLNTLLTATFGAEAHLLKRWNLPFGVSLLAVAERR